MGGFNVKRPQLKNVCRSVSPVSQNSKWEKLNGIPCFLARWPARKKQLVVFSSANQNSGQQLSLFVCTFDTQRKKKGSDRTCSTSKFTTKSIHAPITRTISIFLKMYLSKSNESHEQEMKTQTPESTSTHDVCQKNPKFENKRQPSPT